MLAHGCSSPLSSFSLLISNFTNLSFNVTDQLNPCAQHPQKEEYGSVAETSSSAMHSDNFECLLEDDGLKHTDTLIKPKDAVNDMEEHLDSKIQT